MPSLKAIRKRINAAKGTQKVTKALKAVSASKLRRAQEQILRARPYSYRLRELIERLSKRARAPHALMAPRASVRRVGLLILTSDRGLCGGFNANIIKKAERFLRDHGGDYEKVVLFPAGRKAIDYFRNKEVTVGRAFREAFSPLPGYDKAREIADEMALRFLAGGEAPADETPEAAVERQALALDEIWVVYNEFKSAISQRVVVERLLPVGHDDAGSASASLGEWLAEAKPRDAAEQGDSEAHRGDDREYLYEPGEAVLLDRLVREELTYQVLRTLFESSAGEHGARMNAMDSATTNCKDMIAKQTLVYNRVRQAAITKELIEVVSGAEAL